MASNAIARGALALLQSISGRGGRRDIAAEYASKANGPLFRAAHRRQIPYDDYGEVVEDVVAVDVAVDVSVDGAIDVSVDVAIDVSVEVASVVVSVVVVVWPQAATPKARMAAAAAAAPNLNFVIGSIPLVSASGLPQRVKATQ